MHSVAAQHEPVKFSPAGPPARFWAHLSRRLLDWLIAPEPQVHEELAQREAAARAALDHARFAYSAAYRLDPHCSRAALDAARLDWQHAWQEKTAPWSGADL